MAPLPVLAALDSAFGLPAHPLLVHVVVVLVPLAAIGVAVVAFWPAARRRIGWIVVGVALVGVVSAFLAKESGEALEDTVKETRAVEEHAEMGDSGLVAAGLVFVGAAAVMGVDELGRRQRRSSDETRAPGDGLPSAARRWRSVAIAVGLVAVVISVAGTVRIVQIGHSGAKATWEDNRLSSSSDSPAGAEDPGED